MVKESEVAQSCPTLCDPMGCSLPGSSVHGIFQARVLEWVAISFSRGSSQTMDRTSRIAGRRFTIWATREAWWSQLKTFLYYMHICVCVCVCVCVCIHIYRSHSVVFDNVIPWTVAHQAPLSMGFLRARILEWITIPFSRGSSGPGIKPRFPALQADSLVFQLQRRSAWCTQLYSNFL